MSDDAYQIVSRGPRAVAEAAAVAIDADPALEAATYSILEEDEDKDVWRIDAFPTTPEEVEGLSALLAKFPPMKTVVEKLADADWPCQGCPRFGPGGSSSSAPMTAARRRPTL
jgi:ribosomal protein L11 methyltransferase